MNTQKLLDKGRLVPIYNVVEDTILLMGYRRKTSSRKAHQRPFMLKSGVPIAKIPTDPASEAETVAHDNAEMSPETINEE